MDATAAFPSNQCLEITLTGPDAISKVFYITEYVTKNGYTKEDLTILKLAALDGLKKRVPDDVDAAMDPVARARKMSVATLNRAVWKSTTEMCTHEVFSSGSTSAAS